MDGDLELYCIAYMEAYQAFFELNDSASKTLKVCTHVATGPPPTYTLGLGLIGSSGKKLLE